MPAGGDSHELPLLGSCLHWDMIVLRLFFIWIDDKAVAICFLRQWGREWLPLLSEAHKSVQHSRRHTCKHRSSTDTCYKTRLAETTEHRTKVQSSSLPVCQIFCSTLTFITGMHSKIDKRQETCFKTPLFHLLVLHLAVLPNQSLNIKANYKASIEITT